MMPKRDPFREVEQLFNRMRREMGPPLTAGRRLELPFSDPFTLDLNEVDDAYELLADLPGYKRDDITLTTDGDRKLTIRVEADDGAEDADTAPSRRRRTSASRTVTLPEDANLEETAAEYTNGVLTITVPRQEETDEDTVEIDIE